MRHRAATLGDLFSAWEELSASARLAASRLAGDPTKLTALDAAAVARLALPARRGDGRALAAIIAGGLSPSAINELGGRRMGDVVPDLAGARGSTELAGSAEPVAWSVLAECTLAELSGRRGMGPRRVADLVGRAITAALGSHPDVLARPGNAVAADVRDVLARHREVAVLLAELDDPAAARLLGLRLPDEPNGSELLADLDTVLDVIRNDRDRVVADQLLLQVGQRPTVHEVGQAFGVGAERVRQLRAKVTGALDAALDRAPARLLDAVRQFGATLGATAPLADVDRVLAALGLPAVPDARSLLLVWAAGPYRPVPGAQAWISTDPGDLAVATAEVLARDGGVTDLHHTLAELEHLGFGPDGARQWLDQQPATVLDGVVISLTGTAADVAERLLAGTGATMTAAHLASFDPRIDAALLRRDGRFAEVAEHAEHFELAEWRAEPGDPATVEVSVDEHVLAGGAGPLPEETRAVLGLEPGTRRSLSSRYGPLTVVHDGQHPTRLSLRPIALAIGAVPGDVVVLRFAAGSSDVEVDLRPAPQPQLF